MRTTTPHHTSFRGIGKKEEKKKSITMPLTTPHFFLTLQPSPKSMSSSKTPLLASFFFFFFFFLYLNFHVISALPNPDPATIQPFLLTPSPPATIPAFPEQSDFSGCSLNLPDELFPNIQSACGIANHKHHVAASNTGQERLHYSRCCPVLAAWLYAAYSDTALGRSSKMGPTTTTTTSSSPYDMPQLPDDSETCVDDLEKAMKERKMELLRPNETCDVVYCYCGIRLHPLSCPGAFWVNEKGKVVGDERVKKLERDCLSSSTSKNGLFPGLGGCSKCLHSLDQLHGDKSRNTSKSEDRTSKIHNTDCQLMGLTWLLAKNRTAYIHTVSSVLRAIMMTTDGSDHPRSCTVNSDGLPLAVDSSEISDHSLATPLLSSIYLSYLISPLLLYMLHTIIHGSILPKF